MKRASICFAMMAAALLGAQTSSAGVIYMKNGDKITGTQSARQLLKDARRRLALEVQRGDRRVVMRFRL